MKPTFKQFLIEADEHKPVTGEEVKAAWTKVFPHSSVAWGTIMGSLSYRFRLSKDKSEVANGISDNDPLMYSAFLNKDGTFREDNLYLFTNPEPGSHMAAKSVKMKKKSIKNATVDKIEARFKEVKKFIQSHASDIKDPKFNVKQKLSEEYVSRPQPSDGITKQLDQIINSEDYKQTAHSRGIGVVIDHATAKYPKLVDQIVDRIKARTRSGV